MEQEKKYVDNDVFKFDVSLKWELSRLYEVVYTKPFEGSKYDKEFDGEGDIDDYTGCQLHEWENLVKNKYFTKERIAELKKKLIAAIEAEENPFDIFCSDYDGGYNVTEDELFDLED